MPQAEPGIEITAYLAAWCGGDREALDRVVVALYPEIRRMARQQIERRPTGNSFSSAVLANEAYLKLVRAGGIECENRLHFFAICAQIIRRILVDHARGNRRAKRGGDAVEVTLDEDLLGIQVRGVEMLDLDGALSRLAKIDERKTHVVELRYFGGLSVQETAEVLGVSVETVARDWRMAKAWLFRELTPGRGPS
jgi:RNA polymerase sigma factor (TIGR02999 family)